MKKKNINILMIILSILTSFFIIKNILIFDGVQSIFKIIVIISIVIINLLIYFILFNRSYKRYKLFLVMLFCIFNIASSLILSKVYNYFDSFNKSSSSYSLSLVSHKGNGCSKISDIQDKKIGVVRTNDDSYNEYFNIFIDKYNLKESNEIVYYDNISLMISDLYNGSIDVSVISSNYQDMLREYEEFKDINNSIVSISDDTIIIEKEESITDSPGKDLTESFTVLLMGVDSTKEGISNGDSNGDSLILISFNPKTLNATMLSIPRDSYVPITCFKNMRENKITHASWYGSSCMIDTIENFLNINIDYYVKVNFKGVVSIVNQLGGVFVDVPQDLCTDDSNRNNKICINKGYQLLNGEQALVLARNRYDLKNGDFGRMKNQQLLLTSLLERVKEIDSIKDVISILNVVSNNIDTNMDTNQILSLFSVFKDIMVASKYNDTPITIQNLELVGNSQTIYDEVSKINHWNYILNKQSIKDVSNAIKDNLENNNLIKDFSYNDNNNYSVNSIGSGPYKNNNLYTLLPNFIGKDKSIVDDFVNKYNIKVKYNYIENSNSKYSNNSVISQNHKEKTRIDKINTLEINILVKEENKGVNKLPNFIGMNIDEVKSILNKYGITDIVINEINASFYPGIANDIVISQSYPEGTIISEIKKIELSIVGY